MIRLEKVNKKFDNEYIYSNVDLKFEKNKIYVLAGDNGEGKTTLLNLISKIDSKYEGKINYFNEDYRKLKKEEFLYSKISYVKQENLFFNNLSILDNVKVLVPNYDKKQFNNLLKIFKLDSLKLEKLRKLSGGEKQKVKILLGLLKKSEVLLLDEPYNNLDQDSIKYVNNIISKIKGKVIIIVSHDEYDYPFEYEKLIIDEGKFIKEQTKDKVTQEKGKLEKDSLNINTLLKIKIIFSNLKYSYILIAVMILMIFIFSFVSQEGISWYESNKVYSSIEPGNMILSTTSIPQCDSICKILDIQSFSESDIEKIKSLNGVKEVQELYFTNETKVSNNIIGNSDFEINTTIKNEDINYNLIESDYLKNTYNEKLYNEVTYTAEATSMLWSKEQAKKFPVSITEFTANKMLYGELPNDNSLTEVAIPELMAVDYASKMNLDSIEQLIGKTITIPTINKNTLKEEDKDYKVVGIFDQTINNRVPIIFGYFEDGVMYQHNKPSEEEQQTPEQIEDSYDSYTDTLEELHQPSITLEQYTKLAGDGIESIYIEVDPEMEKEVYNQIKKIYPNKLLISDYEYKYGDVAKSNRMYYLYLEAIILVSTIIAMILILIFSKQYYTMKVKQNDVLTLFGASKNTLYKLAFTEELFQLMFVIGIFTLVNVTKLNIAYEIFIFTIIIFIVVNLIINIINFLIIKNSKRKSNDKS